MNNLQPIARIFFLKHRLKFHKKIEKHEQQQSSDSPLVSAATSKQHIRTAVHSTRPPVNSQQASHINLPRRSRALVSRRSSRSKHSLRIIQDDALQNEVGFLFPVPSKSYSLIPGRQHWTRHHFHGRVDDIPGSNCRRVCSPLWWICDAER